MAPMNKKNPQPSNDVESKYWRASDGVMSTTGDSSTSGFISYESVVKPLKLDFGTIYNPDKYGPADAVPGKHEFGDAASSQPDQDGFWALVEIVDGEPATIVGYKIDGNHWSYWDDSVKHVIDTLPKGLWLFIL